jgi:hypothetical protein
MWQAATSDIWSIFSPKVAVLTLIRLKSACLLLVMPRTLPHIAPEAGSGNGQKADTRGKDIAGLLTLFFLSPDRN